MEPALSSNIAYGSISTASLSTTTSTIVYDKPVCVEVPLKVNTKIGQTEPNNNETESDFNSRSSEEHTPHVYIDHVMKPTRVYDKPTCTPSQEGITTDVSESKVYIDELKPAVKATEYLKILPEVRVQNDVMELERNQCYSLTEISKRSTATPDEVEGISMNRNSCYEQSKIKRRKVRRKRPHKYVKGVELIVIIMSFISILLSILVIIMAVIYGSSSSVMLQSTGNDSSSNLIESTNITRLNTFNLTDIAIYYEMMLKGIRSNISDVSQELIMMNNLVFSLLPEVRKALHYLSSRIDSIHNSINQLRMQATNTCSVLSEQQHITEPVLLDDLGDQTCPVNITKGHQLKSTFVDIDNECRIDSGFTCSITPPSSKSCISFDVASFYEDGRILTDLTCYVAFTNPDILGPVNGTAAIKQESFLDTTTDQNIFNDIISNNPTNVVGCQCLSFETTETISCRYMARHCKYTRGPSISTIVL